MATTIIRTICSACARDVALDLLCDVVTAGGATADLYGDEDLLMWDCPACGHADSYDMTQHDRED